MPAGNIPSGISEDAAPTQTERTVQHNGFQVPSEFKTQHAETETPKVEVKDTPKEPAKVESKEKEAAPTSTGPKTLKIKDKDYSEDDLAKYIESGLRLDDYTRKTQEIAELRKKTQQEYNDFIEYVQKDPEAFVNQLRGQASPDAAQGQSVPDLDRLVDQKVQQKFGKQLEVLQQLQNERLQAAVDRELNEAKKEFPKVHEDDILAYKYIYTDRSAKDIAKMLHDRNQQVVDSYLSDKAKDVEVTEKGSNLTAQQPPESQSGYKTPIDKKGRFNFDLLDRMAFGRK